ncbi:MAG: glycosyltransferase family 39 protein [Nanoarchaeota archaeon]|nr:glycosyltransferase family 39 protein [Nanoarchaeota archaeon]
MKKEKKQTEEEDEGFEIDFSKILSSLKAYRKYFVILGLIVVIGVTWYVRTRAVANLNGEFLLGLDPYVFLRYAKSIVETGTVPVNDTMRYYPSGFDTSRELLMPSYAIAFLHSIIGIFTDMSVSEVAIIYPAIVTCVAMIFFFLFAKEVFGNRVALTSSLLLAVVSGFLFRTSAGFAEKEPIAIFFIFPMLYCFLKALRLNDTKKKIIYSIFGGVCVIGAALSWGGVNFTFLSLGTLFLVLVILGITKRTDSIVYAIMLLSILSVTLFSGRYGSPIDILRNYMFILFPIALLLNLYLYEVYPRIKDLIKKFRPKALPEHFYALLSGVVLLFLFSLIYPGFGYYYTILNFLFERLNNPFGTDVFAMSVNENQAPYFYDPNSHVDWWSPMNYTFFTMILGSFFLFFDMFKQFKKQKLVITTTYILTLLLFIFSRFTTASEPESLVAINNIITALFSKSLFGLQIHHLILFIFAGYMAYFVVKNKDKLEKFKSIKIGYLFLFFWFFVTAIGARGGVRIIFAVCPPAMMLSGYFFNKCYDWVKGFFPEHTSLASLLVYSLFFLLLWYNFSISVASNANFYSSFTTEWDQAMDWVKTSTPEDSVFTHWWDYGYWVQTMGERATTLDGGNFDVALDHLTGRYLFASRVYKNGYFNMTEPATCLALDFGRPDYFLLIDDDVLKYVQMGRIGKRPTYYTVGYFSEEVDNSFDLYNSSMYPTLLLFQSYYGAFPLQEEFNYNNFIFKPGWENTVIYNIVFPYNGSISERPYGVIANQYYPNQYELLPFNCYCTQGKGCDYYGNDGIPECPLLLKDGVVLITQNASDNLFTYLYLLNVTVPGFELAYDNERELTVQGMLSQSITDIKIYKINYEELEPFILDEKLPNYWTAEGGTYW